jgi:hypothetical protein
MGSYSIVLFSILLISSVILVSNLEISFADEVIATSTGFEDSTILELKNARGNSANIDTVRIWLSGENEFKSFKTEQGWIGKNTPQGVIIFTSQNYVNPGEEVKFGIKTTERNPTINWKAIDTNGEIISSASTRTIISNESNDGSELNQPKIVAINENSNFRFIPEKPSSNSDFRIVGENFVPNQNLDFYIGDELKKTIKVDEDGRILFSSKTPIKINDERTEFILQDSGGNEKTISIRIPNVENRQISDIIKLSLGNTPQDVKRGDMITLNGMATPNTTLTITTKYPEGDILNIETIDVGFDGKWTYNNLFSPEIKLGVISIEISDGKSNILRNINMISAKLINVSSIETKYDAGDTATFEGIAIPNQEMSIIIEDSIGTEIISRTISISETGFVNFDVKIPRGSIEGTYVLLMFQGNEEGISSFGIGQEPEEILILRPTKLNFGGNENAEILIQGPSNSQISLILIDSADREKFSESINLGPDGKELYIIDTSELGTGSYTLSGKRGESSGSAIFTVGLTTGSGAISIQATREKYDQGEQMLLLGNTGAVNVLLDITFTSPDGKIVKIIKTFSDKNGIFKIDNFRIPSDAMPGEWKINAKSGGNFKDIYFTVKGADVGLTIELDKSEYRTNNLANISGEGARASATVTLKIFDIEGIKVTELNINAKANGEWITVWQIPNDLEIGTYEILADDGASNTNIQFTLIE